jgi:hypothetical protein
MFLGKLCYVLRITSEHVHTKIDALLLSACPYDMDWMVRNYNGLGKRLPAWNRCYTDWKP